MSIKKSNCFKYGMALVVLSMAFDVLPKQNASLINIYNVQSDSFEMLEVVNKSDDEWKNELDPETYRVTREKGTEFCFAGEFNNHSETGIYQCVSCGIDLFSSTSKHDAESGWPTFSEPVHVCNIKNRPDQSAPMCRTEVLCARCEAHLGHVFVDDIDPKIKRYCINSAALKFNPH